MTGRSLNRRVADLVLVSEDLDRLVREGPISNFDIDVTRDGGWWMVHIPELAGGRKLAIPARSSQWHASTCAQYRYAHRPGGYQLASLHAVTPEGQERSTMRA